MRNKKMEPILAYQIMFILKKIHTSPLAAPPTFFWSFLTATISKLIPPGQSWGETRFLRINSSVKRWHISAYLQAVPGWVLMYLPWSSKINPVISFLAASKHLFSWNLEIKSLSFCSVHRSPGTSPCPSPEFIPNWNDLLVGRVGISSDAAQRPTLFKPLVKEDSFISINFRFSWKFRVVTKQARVPFACS